MIIKIIFSALTLTFFTTGLTITDPMPERRIYSSPAAEKGHAFKHFLSYFEKKELPYTIRPQDMEGYKKEASREIPLIYTRSPSGLSMPSFRDLAKFYIPSSQGLKFSRMGPPVVLPVARFYPDDQSVAIVYELRQRYGSALTRNYHLSYFDLEGNTINPSVKKKERLKHKKNKNLTGLLVASSGYLTTKGFHINPDKNFKIVSYNNDWQLDPSKNNPDQNKLIGFKKYKEEFYRLDPVSGVLQSEQIRTCGTVYHKNNTDVNGSIN